MPRVTVIIPNYNHARYLDQRIRSVLDQSFADFEVLLLDDASSDNSVEIIRRYEGDPRVRGVFVNERNTGIPFVQWNRGFAQARGEFLWIAESDDYADHRLLDVLVDQMDRAPAVGLAYCQSIGVDEFGRAIRSMTTWTDDLDTERWKSDYVNNGRKECSRYLALKCTIPNASAALLRRSVLEEAGRADEDFRLAGDMMLWAKMLLIADVAYVSEPLNYFRIHDNTVRAASAKSAIGIRETIRVLRYISDHAILDDGVRDEALERIVNRWISVASSTHLGLRQHVAVLRQLREVDPRIVRRLGRRALGRLQKMIRST